MEGTQGFSTGPQRQCCKLWTVCVYSEARDKLKWYFVVGQMLKWNAQKESECVVYSFFLGTLFLQLWDSDAGKRVSVEDSTRRLTARPEAVSRTGLRAGVGPRGAAAAGTRLELLHAVPQRTRVHITATEQSLDIIHTSRLAVDNSFHRLVCLRGFQRFSSPSSVSQSDLVPGLRRQRRLSTGQDRRPRRGPHWHLEEQQIHHTPQPHRNMLSTFYIEKYNNRCSLNLWRPIYKDLKMFMFAFVTSQLKQLSTDTYDSRKGKIRPILKKYLQLTI